MPRRRPRVNIAATAADAMDFALILDYFERSPFDYLDLEYSGRTLRLVRARAPACVVLTAPSVGTIASLDGEALPAVCTRVAAGQVLFLLRRFRTTVEVLAPCDGTLTALTAVSGRFVEYGCVLGSIAPE